MIASKRGRSSHIRDDEPADPLRCVAATGRMAGRASFPRPRRTGPRGRSVGPTKKKPGARPGFFGTGANPSERLDLVGLQPLRALRHDEGHLLAFLQALETRGHDRAEVHEYVIAAGAADVAKALGIVEPLDGTGFGLGHRCISLERMEAAWRGESWSQGGNGATV